MSGSRPQLIAVVQLVDSRHEPSPQDVDTVKWLQDEELPFCLVPTKMDKLRQGERQPAIAAIARSLSLAPSQALVPYSSQSGEGRDALLAWIETALAAAAKPR